MSESGNINYINTQGYRTRTDKHIENNPDEIHIEQMDASGNMYESLNTKNAHTPEYDSLKGTKKPGNETQRSRTEKVPLKVVIYVLVAVNVITLCLSIVGFAVVLNTSNRVSSQAERIETIEAEQRTNTATLRSQRNSTVEQKDIRTDDVSDQMVAFTATGSTGGDPLIFTNIIYSYGGSYDNTNGLFTCPATGVYYFASTLTKRYTYRKGQLRCYIYINSREKVGTAQNIENSKNGFSMTISGTFHLNANDTVNIGCPTGAFFSGDDNLCNFTGFLVTSDN